MAKSDTTESDDTSPATDGDVERKPGTKKRLVLGGIGLFAVAGLATLFITGAAGQVLAVVAPGHGDSTEAGSLQLPDIVANLNAGPHRTAFVKLKAKLILTKAADEAAVRAAEGRILDLFQTYLRDMHPEELVGSAGTYRLREELIARANIVLAPARVSEILILEMLVQ